MLSEEHSGEHSGEAGTIAPYIQFSIFESWPQVSNPQFREPTQKSVEGFEVLRAVAGSSLLVHYEFCPLHTVHSPYALPLLPPEELEL